MCIGWQYCTMGRNATRIGQKHNSFEHLRFSIHHWSISHDHFLPYYYQLFLNQNRCYFRLGWRVWNKLILVLCVNQNRYIERVNVNTEVDGLKFWSRWIGVHSLWKLNWVRTVFFIFLKLLFHLIIIKKRHI